MYRPGTDELPADVLAGDDLPLMRKERIGGPLLLLEAVLASDFLPVARWQASLAAFFYGLFSFRCGNHYSSIKLTGRLAFL